MSDDLDRPMKKKVKRVFDRATGTFKKPAQQFQNPRGTAGQIMHDLKKKFNPTDPKVKKHVKKAEEG